MAKEKKQEKSEGAAAPAKKSLLMGVIVPVVLVTLLAGGGGFAFGSFVIGKPAAKPAAEEAAHAAEGEKPAEGEEAADGEAHKAEEGHGALLVRQLAPIVTNLQSPKDTWIRLELSVVMKAEAASEQDIIAVKANDKVLGLLRSTSLSQIDGPSGLLHLREDLTDLLVGGHDSPITEVLISSMVVE